MKTITRRNLLKGIGIGAGAAALAACAAPTAMPPAKPAEPAKPADAKPAAPAVVNNPGSAVTIVHWGFSGGNLEKREKELAAKFNDSQKDVEVDIQVQGSYEETANKLTASLAAKQAPDIVLLSDVWWFKFARAKALLALNDAVAGEKGIDANDFVPSLWNEGLVKGAQHWIPFARSTPLFYYNKTMFKEAGIDKVPDTWQGLVDLAPKLVKKDGDNIKVSLFSHPDGASYIAWLFQCVAWQFGGGYSDAKLTKYELLNPDTIRAGQFYADSVNKGKWAVLSKDPQKDFISGLTATTIMSTGSLGGVVTDAKFDVGTAFLPMEKQFGCCTGGSGLAIPVTTPKEKVQAAMKYIAYATGNDGGAFWAQNSGYMPVRKSTADTQNYKDFFAKNPQFKTAVDQLPKTRPQDAARNYVPGGDNIIGKGLERIIVGKENVEAVWKDITAQLEKEGEPVKKDIAALLG
ncbi:MAG: ABC transporter substrate-binding protein [Chloroflexota bacterium]